MIKKDRKTILVVDDEPYILDLIKIILQDKYELLLATDGKQTMDILKKIKPNLIILDVMMPEINGFEICKIIKGKSDTKNIKIAMLSAKTQEKDIIEGLKLGADYYLTKPFDPIIFEKKIEEMLR